MTAKDTIVLAAGVVLMTGYAVPVRAQAVLSPNKLLFQCVDGPQCGLQTTTLTNEGSVSIRISSITLSGSAFALTNTCGSALKPGQSCGVTILVSASEPGTYTGLLSVNDNAPNSPQTARLKAIVKN
jgi:hypothetical protein